MTKTLTEQWREGTLSDGYYYITSKKWGMLIDRYRDHINDCGDEWRGFDNCQGIVEEVLAPVPSYEEYKQLVSKTDELSRKTLQLEKRLEIATKALEELETKSDKFDNSWSIQEQLDFIKAKCQETLYQIKEMEGVK